MAVLIEWKQPRAAAEIATQRYTEQTKAALRRYWLWWLPAVPIFYFAYFLIPELFWGLVLSVLSMAAAFRWVLVQSIREQLKAPSARYKIIDKGMLLERTYLHRWWRVGAYQFADCQDVPGLRCLEFTSRPFQTWLSWAFDPAEVDESRLRAIMEEYLPGKGRSMSTDQPT